MYPNFNAEFARKGFTLETFAIALDEIGYGRTVPTLSLKKNGEAPLTLAEAKAWKKVVGTDLPLDVLFEEAS